MAFTFSHPALVAPLLARKNAFLSHAALIIGSLSPDFEYFIMTKKAYTQLSHTLLGLLLFNLPLGMFLFILYHGLVRAPLFYHLPTFLFKRFVQYDHLNWKDYLHRHWPKVLFSLLIGAATHLAWDWLIHKNADFMYYRQHIIFSFASWKHHSVIYTLTNTAHSLIGLIILFWFIYKMPVTKNRVENKNRRKFWITLGLISLLFCLVKLFIFQEFQLQTLLISLVAGFIIGLILTSLLFRNGNKNSFLRNKP